MAPNVLVERPRAAANRATGSYNRFFWSSRAPPTCHGPLQRKLEIVLTYIEMRALNSISSTAGSQRRRANSRGGKKDEMKPLFSG
jgi:hypothetical protein